MTALKFSFLLFLFLTPEGPENPLTGKVVGVDAGDTITLDVRGDLFKIRLAEIDSPDVKQPFYRQAREFTHRLVLGKFVTVNYYLIDRYHRLIGDVVLPDGRNLNQLVVEAGWAWHYPATFSPSETLRNLEYEAWKHKLGLWVDPKPVPPWELRREDRVPPPPPAPNQVDYDQVLEYGIVGDRKKRVYRWPACGAGVKIPPENRAVFSNKLQAESLGFRVAKPCHNG